MLLFVGMTTDGRTVTRGPFDAFRVVRYEDGGGSVLALPVGGPITVAMHAPAGPWVLEGCEGGGAALSSFEIGPTE